MDNTAHPAVPVEALERLGVSEMLTAYVPRQHICRRVNWHRFERFVREQGFQVVREGFHLYGKIGHRPSCPAPKLRIITKNDYAAVYGGWRSRRVA